MVHPRGAFKKGPEKVIEGKVYHPIGRDHIHKELSMRAEFYKSNGHNVKWLIDEDTGLVTLWVSRRDEEFKEAQKASSAYPVSKNEEEEPYV